MLDSPTPSIQSQDLSNRLEGFVSPLLQWLDAQIDQRLVRTFLPTLQAILMLRHTRYGLLLSELGSYVLNADQGPAGTKRLSNLLRSPQLTYSLIERFLWHRAQEHLDTLVAANKTALVIWDESVIEKPESIALEQQVRFILRWPSRLKPVDEKGHRNAWRITQGKRSQDHREIWDARRGCFRKTGIVVAPVTHIQYDQPLWLVVSRPGPGRQPWYLLTNEPVATLEEA